MKKYTLLSLLVFLTFNAFSQISLSKDLQQLFYKAYYTNNMQLWELGIERLQKAYTTSKDPLWLVEIARAETGLVGACLANNNKKVGKEKANQAEEYLDKAMKQLEKNADVHALYAAVFGMQIGFSPLKGMWLGPKSGKHVSKALKLNDNHALAYFQKASSYYHTPSAFGGDIPLAIENFKKSVAIYEKDPSDLDSNWQYLNALVWLGQAYLANDQKKEALETFKKCLDLAPEFGWVKHHLLAKAEKVK